jgi:hypothetical protein
LVCRATAERGELQECDANRPGSDTGPESKARKISPEEGQPNTPSKSPAEGDLYMPNVFDFDKAAAEDVTETRKKLLHGGFEPLPVSGKQPVIKDWQKTKIDDAEVTRWGRFPDAGNTGLRTRLMPTLDADILDPDASKAIERLVQERFKDRGLLLTRIGKEPKRAFPFRTDTPFPKITINLVAPDGDTAQKLEFLGDGQHVVGFGTHPDTGKPYKWHGINGELPKLEALPLITEDEAQELIEDAADLLCAEFGYTYPAESAGDGTAADWGQLLDNIHKGVELHASIRDLAFKLIVSGMGGGAAVNLLREAMKRSAAARDDRWEERYRDIPRAVETAEEKLNKQHEAPKSLPPDTSLDEVHDVARKWLGKDFDMDAVDAVAAVAASLSLGGDPAWLLIISGSGAGKTEVIQSLAGAGAIVTSTITSEGALLSATKSKNKFNKGTGGLLKLLGDQGILVIKDFTSIISMHSNIRQTILAALREIHDGFWQRNVGNEGGQTLTYRGRACIIAGVTTAWASACRDGVLR